MLTTIFGIFLWKNFKYGVSSWKIISLQLIGFTLLLVAYMSATNNVITLPQTEYEFKTEEMLKSYFSGEDDDFIFYAPKNQFLDKLMEDVRVELSMSSKRLLSFNSTKETFLALEEKKNSRSLAIFFDLKGEEVVPQNGLHYNICALSNKVSTTGFYLNDVEVVGIRDYDDYIDSGFFVLKSVIDKCFTRLVSGEESPFIVEIAPMPFYGVNVTDNMRVVTYGIQFSFFLYILVLTTVVVPIVEEKQDGIKEFLALTTPYSYLNGISFYFVRFWILLIFVLSALVTGYIWQGMGSISVIYVFILFILFLCSGMCYGFLITVLSSSVFYAKVGGLILLLMPIALFTFELPILHPLSYFFSANTFLEGMTTFQKFTNKHREFTFNSMFVNITETSFQISSIYSILLIQCFLYSVLYWYLSHLFPGEGGIKKPFYFIFQSSFYRQAKTDCEREEDSLKSEVAVKIRNLTKMVKDGWRKEKAIVNNLNMDIGANRITVLLGHNGAGKTTTINMIVGCVQKTCGEIKVCNLSEAAIYRHLIGYCPQNNVFMQYLSCAEHLHFFSRLRGLSGQDAEQLTTDLLQKLRLDSKAHEPGRNLSGGMKRRLSLGLAISGNTKIIILDEPSSGLDPESRRELWNILLELRKNQAILITTHHMEEAEVLGDTVAILSSGKLVCSGTCMELKRSFGSGYILKLLTGPNFNENKTIEIIRNFVPTAKIKTFVRPTLYIALPYMYQNRYEQVLKEVETLSSELGILSISMTNTSLEEVFLNCESYSECDEIDSTNETITIPYEKLHGLENNPTKSPRILAHQGFAVFYKKSVFIKREWLYSLIMFCIPLLSSLVSMHVVTMQPSAADSHSLSLSLNSIPHGEIFLKIPESENTLREYFLNEVKKSKLIIHLVGENSDLPNQLLELQGENLNNFYDYIVGTIEVSQTENGYFTIQVLHSPNMIHSSVILLNLVNDVVYKYETSNAKGSITTVNIPIKRTAEISPARLDYFNMIMPVGWLFYMIFFITLPFKEEKSEFKKLQLAPRFVYWISFTIFDVLIHLVICFLAYLIQRYSVEKEIFSNNELVWLMTSFMFYGISYLPLLYILASSFRSMSTLSAFFLLVASISSITPLITSSNQQSMLKYETVIKIMSLLPDFSLNHQLRLISENYFVFRRNHILKNQAIKAESSSHYNLTRVQAEPLDSTIFFFYAIFVFIVAEIFLIYVWDDIKKKHFIRKFFSSNCCQKKGKLIQSTIDEVDVSTEKENVQTILRSGRTIAEYPLIVRNLHKNYGKVHAVRGLNFAVKKGECFGLLGINGAGKTSTFQMITVSEQISDGEVLIEGVNIFKNENTYKFLFGYCPQTDALNDFMTSYEILKYTALLRGIRLQNTHQEVMRWLSRLDLTKYKNCPIKNYSGGTKRKLNTAIAMIGSPAILFLDEPTTGVDPVSRRFMWKCIQDFQKEDKTIVLTSHSMNECEYLCNRLAIMASGQFECLGYIPTLKVKFGCGFTLTFHLKANVMTMPSNLDYNLRELFTCELKEQHAGTVTYFVYEKDILWSRVFNRAQLFFDENRNLLKDYSVNETTLEDIFLKFEGKNKEPETSFM